MLWFNEVFKRSSTSFLIWVGAAIAISNIGWRVVMNNFAVEAVGMNGNTVGILQSLREIPGLLAFTVLFWLAIIKEQKIAVVSLSILGIGVAITGFFPTIYGFYFTTMLMSVGFHYLESISTSLTAQFYTKDEFNQKIGILKSADSLFSIIGFILILLMLNLFSASFKTVFFVSGAIAFLVSLYLFTFKNLKTNTPPQKNKIVVRKKYTLFYILVFLAGARRQIFVVFAGFLLVQKFGFSVSNIAILFFVSHLTTVFLAPQISNLITKLGPKNTLVLEYFTLTIVFIMYASVNSSVAAAILYIVDGLAFALSLALKSYFKSIANPTDISATTSVSFTINHIAAVFLPFILGGIWLESYKYVFYIGATFAIMSMLTTLFIKQQKKNTNPII